MHSFTTYLWKLCNGIVLVIICSVSDENNRVTETPLEYTHVDMFTGETVTLSCNTSADDVMWTYDTNDGYVDYIYWNQLVDNDKRRLSVNVTANDFHNLIISDVHVDDSGRYDCYDNSGVRVVGYQLTVNRMYYFIAAFNITKLQISVI